MHEEAMEHLIGKYLRFLILLLKYVLPLALLAFLAMPVFGHLVRWTPAEQALEHYKNETPVMVGGSYKSNSTVSDSEVKSSSYRERVYILFPSMFSAPKTVTVSQTNDEPYKISEDQYGILDLLITLSLTIFGVWWFWLRRPGKI
jgi:hypothetical protein